MIAAASARDLFRLACRYDVIAFKPGNVSIARAGHGMRAQDFLHSAASAAPALTAGLPLGRSIRLAMEATLSRVGCNTNLGSLLLAAPLLRAALARPESLGLAAAIQGVLAATTQEDAAEVYAAIRAAQPAGLGTVSREDVQQPPRCTLREAMCLAARRDCIAAQYANGFSDVLSVGVPTLWQALSRGAPLSEAVSACFLTFLGRFEDSHIARKWGRLRAAEVSAECRAVTLALKACDTRRGRWSILSAFDKTLKRRGLNPGTSADLTVASLLALLLEGAYGERPAG